LWKETKFQQVSFYLNKVANLPQSTEGEAILFDLIPKDVKKVIDLGIGDGHLLKLLKRQILHIKAIALDVSPIVLDAARNILPFCSIATTQVKPY
jgi:tRNA (cmo5U34)-methyltransferase